MRAFITWLFTAALITISAAYVLQFPAGQHVEVAPQASPIEGLPAPVIPWASRSAQPFDGPLVSWCEPIEQQPCVGRGAMCSPLSDGTRRVCMRQWYSQDVAPYVCAIAHPTRKVQRHQADRLRVLVDDICKPRDGCNPGKLHDYLAVLIMRESSWRPYKVHRLSEDLEANQMAWSRGFERYADNPAAGDPVRWSVGRGYFGQNAAAWLDKWDVNAIPETLCGEVESVLVHLRGARARWRRLDHGVVCDGEEYRGLGDGPTWYDVSRVNSGSDPCPRDDRERFEHRAASRGLDPYEVITLPMLGRVVPRDEQNAFAARAKRRMDKECPKL